MQFSHLSIVIGIVLLIIILFLGFAFVRRIKRRSYGSGNEQIYIGNLPYRVTERDLRHRFSQYGDIADVRIVKDRRTGRSKGYAFIKFSTEKEAKKSLADHGKDFSGRSLVVHIAKPR